MKSTTLKNIIVVCGAPDKKEHWRDEIQVDSAIFDDPLLEAATRAIEKRKNQPDFKVTVVLECYEKKNARKPMLHFCYNTYVVMINAGLHEKAELLRLNFKKIYGVDLKTESIKGGKDDGSSNSDQPKLN